MLVVCASSVRLFHLYIRSKMKKMYNAIVPHAVANFRGEPLGTNHLHSGLNHVSAHHLEFVKSALCRRRTGPGDNSKGRRPASYEAIRTRLTAKSCFDPVV